jgi:hypothetical protein
LEIVEEAKTTSIVKQREYIYYVEHAVSNSELYLLKAAQTYKGAGKDSQSSPPNPKQKKQRKEKK